MAFVTPLFTPLDPHCLRTSQFCPNTPGKRPRCSLLSLVGPLNRCFQHRATASDCQASSKAFSSMTLTSTEQSTKPKILIAGAPASGKGTQCEMIVEKYGVVHISTGDMLRAEIKNGSKLGLAAQTYMNQGRLVPDELVISMMKQRLSNPDCEEKGWLLDGFPRTPAQAKALDDVGIVPSAVIFLNVEEDALVDRVIGRRTDPVTGKIYHLSSSPPPNTEIAKRLTQRSDDTEGKVIVRLESYNKYAKELHDHYESKALDIDGNQSRSDIFKAVSKAIDASLRVDEAEQQLGETANGKIAEPGYSTKGMPIPAFVKLAEEAFEKGEFDPKDVPWSGQAGMEVDTVEDGSPTYGDIGRRADLFLGDMVTILAFAWIGRASHGSKALDFVVLRTAFPFLLSWIAIAPILGAYGQSSTSTYQMALQTLIRSWAVCVPTALAFRGVLTGHMPPVSFAIVSLTSTLILLGSWRSLYVKVNANKKATYRKGNFIDGIKMITTLLRRW